MIFKTNILFNEHYSEIKTPMTKSIELLFQNIQNIEYCTLNIDYQLKSYYLLDILNYYITKFTKIQLKPIISFYIKIIHLLDIPSIVLLGKIMNQFKINNKIGFNQLFNISTNSISTSNETNDLIIVHFIKWFENFFINKGKIIIHMDSFRYFIL